MRVADLPDRWPGGYRQGPMEAIVLAHAGGIDEIAMVLAPLVVFLLLRRASRKRRGQEKQNDDTNHTSQA
jgi:hypothetical protein